MRILVGCEYSGIVRNAFASLGHDAWSCDIIETISPGQHIKTDLLNIINDNWDLVIAFPPCTFLTYAGNRFWSDPLRTVERIKAASFFMSIYNSKCKYICVENPNGIMFKLFRLPDQVIHPYYFGEPIVKRTCLWLKNLPLLKYSLLDNLFFENTACEKPKPITTIYNKDKNVFKYRHLTDYTVKSGQERSLFFSSIALAMANQWCKFILDN